MAANARDRFPDSAFTERVLQRVAVAEQDRRRREWLRFLLPVSTIVVIGGAWAIALPVGASTVRFLAEMVAWLLVVGRIEQHLSGALLGPCAPFPSIVSLCLLLAALAWVRMHQPGPPGWRP